MRVDFDLAMEAAAHEAFERQTYKNTAPRSPRGEHGAVLPGRAGRLRRHAGPRPEPGHPQLRHSAGASWRDFRCLEMSAMAQGQATAGALSLQSAPMFTHAHAMRLQLVFTAFVHTGRAPRDGHVQRKKVAMLFAHLERLSVMFNSHVFVKPMRLQKS